ncbi:alanine racemase [Echinimonas agarilytica]|uniref:Alanine racemase n=1 Tax=Echinimonas agarilytica TaxID=1215918 RepID=A0AA42B6S9_9GAMM|nr:alanine racemase [Echinimonas agarilytica]
MHVAVATISRAALAHNLQRVREYVPNCPVMVMLKANAYGHGIVEVAKALADADAFGVARLQEAVTLRKAGFKQRIVLLEGFFCDRELPLICELSLEAVVHQQWQIDALSQATLSQPIRVWLKVDSGMHRLGIPPEAVTPALQQLKLLPHVLADMNMMTHFACADDLSSGMTATQIKSFNTQLKTFKSICPSGEVSLANSAAIVAHKQSHQGWVRPGIMLYGASPMLNGSAEDHQLMPVMSLTSKVMAVRNLKANETVGYGATWSSDKNTRIAVVAIGYGDGYPRHAANGTPVLINGQRCALVGRVSMDMITVDIGLVDVAVGDDVELWGSGLSANEVAASAGTIAYELFCSVTQRVLLRYI